MIDHIILIHSGKSIGWWSLGINNDDHGDGAQHRIIVITPSTPRMSYLLWSTTYYWHQILPIVMIDHIGLIHSGKSIGWWWLGINNDDHGDGAQHRIIVITPSTPRMSYLLWSTTYYWHQIHPIVMIDHIILIQSGKSRGWWSLGIKIDDAGDGALQRIIIMTCYIHHLL